MAISCDKKTNIPCSSATGHDDPQICGQNLQLGKLVVRKQTSCVVQLAKRLCFIVRMVNSPIRCKIRTMQTNTNPIFKSIRRCTVFKQEGHWSKLIVLRNACYKSVGDLKLSSKCRRQLKCFFPGKYFVQNNLIYRRL